MATDTEIFGLPYLDADNFRAGAAVFGVGMALADFSDSAEGNRKLNIALCAASRLIDAETGRDFSPAERTEQHHFDFASRQLRVRNAPIAEVVSLSIIFAPGTSQTFSPADIYINNSLNYIEITDAAIGFGIISERLNMGLTNPVAEIVYKSATDIPKAIRLACGYQAAKMINDGFVDKTLPANFGQIDMDDFVINNKKGYRLKKEDIFAARLDATAESLISQFKTITVR